MSEQMKMGPEAHASADTIIRASGAVSASHLNEIEFLNDTRTSGRTEVGAERHGTIAGSDPQD